MSFALRIEKERNLIHLDSLVTLPSVILTVEDYNNNTVFSWEREVNEGQSYWYWIPIPFDVLSIIKVNLWHNSQVIYTEQFKFNNNLREKVRLGQHINCSGIGDILILTPICRYFDCVIELHPEYEKLKDLFEGIAEVKITSDAIWTTNCGEDHATLKKMRNFFTDDELLELDNTPYVRVSAEDIKWATDYLYSLNLTKPPIAFVPNCSKGWAHIRETNPEYWQEIINSVDKYTFLQFGVSETMTKFENVIEIPDLTLKQLKAMYRVIGKYVGVDTGDLHLMLAVGGEITALIPPSQSVIYYHGEWCYFGHKKAKYVLFEDYKKIVEIL